MPPPCPVPVDPRVVRRWRVALSLVALVCLAAALWMIRWRLGRGATWSPLFVVTLAGVLASGLLQAIGAALPEWRLWRLHGGLCEWSVRLQTTWDYRPLHRWAWCCFFMAAGVFLAGALNAPVDIENDQKAFLALARQIGEHGGIAALARDLYVGGPGREPGWYREANRHPFYPAFLNSASAEDAQLVTRGRLLSALFVLLVVLILAEWLSLFEGGSSAWVFVVLCLMNRSLFEAASTVACEGLMVAAVAFLWADVTGGKPGRWSGRQGSFFGMGCAIVWLTKGTGLLFTGGMLLWFWLWRWFEHRPNPSRSEAPSESPATRTASTMRWTLWFVVGWSVCASPLLVRNIREFGSPFHNENSWLLFVDEFEDPHALSMQRSLGEQAREYARTHSVGQMVRRAVSGVMWEGLILTRSLGPLPLGDGRLLPGAVLLAFAAAGLWARRDAAGGLLVVWLVTQFPLYAWYVPVAAGDRFVTPLVAPLLVYAAVGMTRVWGAITQLRSCTAPE